MKELFQIIQDPRFHLLYGVTQRFSAGPQPQRVRLNREGCKLVEGVTKRASVHPNMRLAVHPNPGKGDKFSPIFGKITDVSERSIFIDYIEPDEELRSAAAAVKKSGFAGRPGTGAGVGGTAEKPRPQHTISGAGLQHADHQWA